MLDGSVTEELLLSEFFTLSINDGCVLWKADGVCLPQLHGSSGVALGSADDLKVVEHIEMQQEVRQQRLPCECVNASYMCKGA